MRMNSIDEQLRICQRFSSDFVPPEGMQKIGIAMDSLQRLPLNALRVLPKEGTCGWYIWGGDMSTSPDFFVPLHVYHLGEKCAALMPYLALAPGWRVQLAPGHEDVWFDAELR